IDADPALSKAEGSRNGVILADEMGLGKSIQVILFLHFMIMNTHKWKNALLVMPAGLLSDWKGKLENWTPDITVLISQISDKELLSKLRRLQKTGGILLVSYDMFIKHHQTHTTYKGMPFIWDCLVFDEAHRLKNTATKNHKVAASISAGCALYLLVLELYLQLVFVQPSVSYPANTKITTYLIIFTVWVCYYQRYLTTTFLTTLLSKLKLGWWQKSFLQNLWLVFFMWVGADLTSGLPYDH
uniref:Helicase ATP-binding domain-containing protein n=1 Tax=Astyanax mexicanus TaxID=7994 RepID=A0A8B9L3R7_ASTMX